MSTRFICFASILSALLPMLCAQQDRIGSRINAAQPLILTGHVHAKARAEFDRGAVDPSFSMPSISLHLKGSASQQAALAQLLAEQQDPASPRYHQWLTPEEYAATFGVSQNDLDQISAWAQSQGFTVSYAARSRNYLVLSGTAGQAQKAFKVKIHNFQLDGKLHYANVNDPSIPAALAGVVTGIRGLHDFRLKPRYVKASSIPEMTSAAGVHHMAPDDFATIYNVSPLYKDGVDGTGQRIAVVGQTRIKVTDIAAFRTKFNLAPANLEQVLVPNRPDPGISSTDVTEANLDIEWAGAVARNATIAYVYSDDVVASLHYAIDQNVAPIISMSYGSCEAQDLIDLPLMQQAAQQANALGITWIAASGDNAAADCDDVGAAIAQNGFAVDAPASIPEVTGMGGSEFVDIGLSYWSATNTANSASAQSYIPERVWNDTVIDGGLSGGGGGASIFFAKPIWQTGPGVPAGGFRRVPDLSLSSSAAHVSYYIYSGGGSYVGGTSVAAPAMSGIVALLNQYLVSTGAQKQAGAGNINPALYRIAQSFPAVFHDIVQGDSSVPCAAGSPDCVNGSFGKSAGPGYDEATGLGSPDAYNLIHKWSTAPAVNSAVVISIDQSPVFRQASTVSGNPWSFMLTLTEEAGIGTTLTKFTIDGKAFDIAASFGSATIGAGGTLNSKNLGLSGVAVPKTVVISLSGVDASGRTWTEDFPVLFSGPQIPLVVGGASNAASGQQSYAPGMLLSVYGTSMGNVVQPATAIPLPSYMAGFEANIDGVVTPLYYVSPGQVNIQIPYETQPGTSTLTVGNPYVNVTYTLNIAPAAPGIFTSNGFVSAPFSSAKRGQATTLFITGEGRVRPSLTTGDTPAPSTPLTRLPKPIQSLTMTVGGQAVVPDFFGIPSGLVGVTQINYTVPATAPLGVQPVIVTVGGVASMPVNLTVTQ